MSSTIPEEPLLITPDMLVSSAPAVLRTPFERGIAYFPWLTLSLIAICVMVFVAEIATGALLNVQTVIAAGALFKSKVFEGEVWRLVSAMFLHGSWGHLLGNSSMFYILGMAAEHAYGVRRTLLIYLFCGISGCMLSVLASPGPSVGASGAIFGLFGVLVTFFVRHRQEILLRDKRIGIILSILAVFQISMGFLTPHVDNFGHVGGFFAGCLAGIVVSPTIFSRRSDDQAQGREMLLVPVIIIALFITVFLRFGYFHTLQAIYFLSAGQPARAVQETTVSLSMNPGNSFAYYLRSNAHLSMKNQEAAISDAWSLIQSTPQQTTGYRLLSRIYSITQQYDNLISELTRIIKLQPYDINAYNSRGYTYCRLRKYDLAAVDFMQIIKIAPRYAPAYGNLGLIMAIKGNYSGAIDLLKKAIVLDRSLVKTVPLVQALEYDKMGLPGTAVVSYQKFVKAVTGSQETSDWSQEVEFAEARIKALSK